jgi:hypothetical protein
VEDRESSSFFGRLWLAPKWKAARVSHRNLKREEGVPVKAAARNSSPKEGGIGSCFGKGSFLEVLTTWMLW